VLVAAVRDGDEDALALLYDRYAARIYTLAVRITGDQCTAQDVTQEIFLTLWRGTHTYDPAQGAVGAWLLAMARCRVLDELRCQHRRPPIVEGWFVGDGGSHPEPGMAAASDQGAGAAVTAQAFARLPVEQRHVIELAYFGGLTQKEIADVIGAPLSTIRCRMHAGMEGMCRELAALRPGAPRTKGTAR
jgi:RNA polymerase sigma-70 factor (ECF subfamily)